MHWSGEINLMAILGVFTLLLAIAAVLIKLGGMQGSLQQLVEDWKNVANELRASDDRLTLHQAHDESLFREMSATLNQIVGKLGGK